MCNFTIDTRAEALYLSRGTSERKEQVFITKDFSNADVAVRNLFPPILLIRLL